LSKEAHRLSVIGCAGARCVEKLFELPLFGGREVGQYLLVGNSCGRFRAFQQRLALGGELSRQRSTRGHRRRARHGANVFQPAQLLVHRRW
jgi:hypothetical protein